MMYSDCINCEYSGIRNWNMKPIELPDGKIGLVHTYDCIRNNPTLFYRWTEARKQLKTYINDLLEDIRDLL